MRIIVLTDYYTDKFIGIVRGGSDVVDFVERWLQENEDEAYRIEYHEGGRIGIHDNSEVQISGDNGLIIWNLNNLEI